MFLPFKSVSNHHLVAIETSSFTTFIDWYYLAFPRDKWRAKGLVLFIYLIETAQTLVMTNDCRNTFVKGFGDINSLNDIFDEWLAIPLLTAIGE